jgi:hypothetical protein
LCSFCFRPWSVCSPVLSSCQHTVSVTAPLCSTPSRLTLFLFNYFSVLYGLVGCAGHRRRRRRAPQKTRSGLVVVVRCFSCIIFLFFRRTFFCSHTGIDWTALSHKRRKRKKSWTQQRELVDDGEVGKRSLAVFSFIRSMYRGAPDLCTVTSWDRRKGKLIRSVKTCSTSKLCTFW